MNENRKIEPDKIKIVEIRTIKGNIDGDANIDPSEVHGHGFEFETGLAVEVEKKVVGVRLVVNIEALNKQGAPLNVKGAYTHQILFEVGNLTDFVEEPLENATPKIGSLMVSTLISIAYSTVRGIIYSRTQGTSLSVVILPVIDPKTFISMKST